MLTCAFIFAAVGYLQPKYILHLLVGSDIRIEATNRAQQVSRAGASAASPDTATHLGRLPQAAKKSPVTAIETGS